SAMIRTPFRWAMFAAGVAALSACGGSGGDGSAAAITEHWGLVDRYCTDCHNDSEFAGNVSLEGVTPDGIAAKPELWEGVVRKLRGDLMPPPSEPRPDAAVVDAFVASVEATLDEAAAARGPAPGSV